MKFSFGKLFNLSAIGLGPKKQSVVGIDIGLSSIKAVQLRLEKGVAILETYGEIALGPYVKLAISQAANVTDEQLIEATRDLFKEANITTNRAALGLPLKSSLLQVIELPAYDEKRLAEMIPLEARKYIPVPTSEVMLDWWTLPKHTFSSPDDNVLPTAQIATPRENVEILVVAIHNATIEQYRKIADRLKLVSNSLEVEAFSAIRSTIGHELSPVVILDMGAATTKMIIVDYGIVRVSHTINKGAQDITLSLARSLNIPFEQAEKLKRAEGVEMTGDGNSRVSTLARSEMGDTKAIVSSTLEYIFFEANRVLVDYQRRHGRVISRVVLIGGGALLKGIISVAQKSMQVPVTLGEPFQKVQAPAFLGEVLKEIGPEFAIATGLALRGLQEQG